ncbi:Rhomboid family protein [Roseovarius litorisediminis]|uniref:Rhomboid family protein n=1 Tax=Roseovarius litorisediminis TaxID=1312363 RepID=A0A1Y5T4Z7_9RHOB|nr:rhomboid family intramembrane serine protease [Roseovarius litorisediminis]SLN55914.1 Rhomboid family protein [Roseovarius litorisediminis]
MKHLWRILLDQPVILVLLILSCVLPELALQGADYGFWGTSAWRPLSYAYGAFWPGILQGWTPNYPAQPFLMFCSYAFLHTGLAHMIPNMIVLGYVGRLEIDRVGSWRFLIVYLMSVLGGGVGYALLAQGQQSMVGASGALFGLFGAWAFWDLSGTLRERPGLSTLAYAILWPIVVLSFLNLMMYWAADGNVAWATHLGGTLTGALIAPLFDRRPAQGEPAD